jgi:methylmalonyl-CoA/ethylmalonyl-CoA epimerase
MSDQDDRPGNQSPRPSAAGYFGSSSNLSLTTAAPQGGLTAPKMGEITRLHHVGFVVSSIPHDVESFAQSIGAHWDEAIFHDPLQKARVTFLRTPCPTDPLIELVEPAGGESPVLRFLQNGGGLHHLCYEVEDLDAHLRTLRTKGAVIVRRPLPAAAFENRRIAWTLTKQKLLLECLERQQV